VAADGQAEVVSPIGEATHVDLGLDRIAYLAFDSRDLAAGEAGYYATRGWDQHVRLFDVEATGFRAAGELPLWALTDETGSAEGLAASGDRLALSMRLFEPDGTSSRPPLSRLAIIDTSSLESEPGAAAVGRHDFGQELTGDLLHAFGDILIYADGAGLVAYSGVRSGQVQRGARIDQLPACGVGDFGALDDRDVEVLFRQGAAIVSGPRALHVLRFDDPSLPQQECMPYDVIE
jgi:hypothetical protein